MVGLCGCGCGKPTNIAPQTRPEVGFIKGQPYRYLRGHSGHVKYDGSEYTETDRGYETACWIWPFGMDGKGYGRIRGGLAYQWFYARSGGVVPSGLQLDHLCKQRDCVNPDHLEPVTLQENVRRGRAAKLDPEKVREIRKAYRSGETTNLLGERYGVHAYTIWCVVTGRRWADVLD
jgi:hypothetical protein